MQTTLKTSILIARTMILVGLFFFASDLAIELEYGWQAIPTIKFDSFITYIMWASIGEIALKLLEMFTL